ncbi:MAG: hypothetical protein K1X28_05910 [Parachlamydiales bacterium]|nr:hypothetical protein [Parachlamydiales bacterium]
MAVRDVSGAQAALPALETQAAEQTFCGRVYEKLSDAWTGLKDVAHRMWVAVRDFFVGKYEWVKEKWSGKPVEVISPVTPPAPVQQPRVEERREEPLNVAPFQAAPPPQEEDRQPQQQEVQAPIRIQVGEFVPFPQVQEDVVLVQAAGQEQPPVQQQQPPVQEPQAPVQQQQMPVQEPQPQGNACNIM